MTQVFSSIEFASYAVNLSVPLFVINLFGWNFPDKITLLGNEFGASDVAVHFIAWIFAFYWGWEFWISFRSQIGWWKTDWRSLLMHRLRNREELLRQVNPADIIKLQGKQPSLELVTTQLEWKFMSKAGSLNMSGHGMFCDPNKEQRSFTQVPASFSIEYKKIRWERFTTTLRFMALDPRAFNLWVPWLIGALAVLTELFRFFGDT